MAKRKTIENAGSEAVANPDSTPEQAQPKTELPSVESPSISPAQSETAAKPVFSGTPAEPEVVTSGSASRSRFILRPRHKRHVLLATSVVIAAAFGAVVGAATGGGFSRPAAVDVAVEENKATQQSVARLSKEIVNLKASLEANKSVYSQIAKISERLNRESAEITGSIAPPQTIPPTSQTSAPLPNPRPASAIAGMQPRLPRLSIVSDWSIREARDGYIYVQGHGDVYQVLPGAPLPGLGPVEQIKRQDGRWMVVTPKGIIVSMRDRHYFEQF
jgi:hypothetical protein